MSTDYDDWCCCGIRSSKIDFSHTHRQYILHWGGGGGGGGGGRAQSDLYRTLSQEFSLEIKSSQSENLPGGAGNTLSGFTHAEFHKGRGAGDLSPSPGASKSCLDT